MGRAGSSGEAAIGDVRLPRQFAVLDGEALTGTPLGADADPHASYLVELHEGQPVQTLFCDAWTADAPEDVTFSRGLSFLAPLLNELAAGSGKSYRIIDGSELAPLGLDEQVDEFDSCLVEFDGEAAMQVLWSERNARDAREDLTLTRDFAFIAPLLNRLATA